MISNFITHKAQPAINLNDVSIIDTREENKKYFIDFAFNKELFGDNATRGYWVFSRKTERDKALKEILSRLGDKSRPTKAKQAVID